jgi:hypothetical protein
MNQTYYIPINSGSLAHYLSKALILPSIYLPNKPEDIQNKFQHSILLSKNKLVKNSDCSIEVVLTLDEERESISLSENFLQLNTPLPISRIKKIYFLDEKQMETVVWNINNGAAFIPQHLIAILKEDNTVFYDDNIISKEIDSSLNSEIEKRVNRFDTALGGFAFMKVASKSFGNVSAEFSDNYFITLSSFNKIIEEQTLKAEKEKDLIFSRKYLGLFSSNSSEWSKWHRYIYKNVELQDVEEIAEKEGITVEKKFGLLNISKLDNQSHIYDIAILATYGDRKNKSIDDLVNNLHNGTISGDKIEDIAILFGLNTGYSKFRNKYKANNKEFNIKFKLDSRLDYYTIESIYQFSFKNNRNNGKFEYIDKIDFPSEIPVSNKGLVVYSILDKTVVAKKKTTPLEEFMEKYAIGFYEKLSNSAKQYIPAYATLDNEKAIAHFKGLLNDSFVFALQQFEKEVLAESEELFNDEKQSLISSYEEKIELLKNKIKENKEIKAETGAIKTFSDESEITEISVVNEPTVSTNLSKDYEKMSLPDLKKEAKEKGIKIFAKATKKDIIELIKNTPPLLL